MNSRITLWRVNQVEEERLKGNAGLQVSLQDRKGIFNYVSLPIKAKSKSAESSWQGLTTLPVYPDTSEPLDNNCLPACHRAALAWFTNI
jgi:hypothetical protein